MTTPLEVRVERDVEGGGLLVLSPHGHGWQHTNLNHAIADALAIADGFGVAVKILTDGQPAFTEKKQPLGSSE